jgi:hypothetical protein
MTSLASANMIVLLLCRPSLLGVVSCDSRAFIPKTIFIFGSPAKLENDISLTPSLVLYFRAEIKVNVAF